jgi:hypothetical protein
MQAESNRQRFESPIIRTVSDIKRILAQLEPHSHLNAKFDDVILSTDMAGTDVDHRSQKYHVSAKTKTSSMRDVIIEGLNIVKQREETAAKVLDRAMSIAVDGKDMKPPSVISENSFMSVDPIINRTLGGYRNGHYIQWNLADGFIYRYDIFEHRLTRFQSESEQ